MKDAEIITFICQKLQETSITKGVKQVEVNSDTAILGGSLPVDSLDLAAIVVELESITGRDPFREGIVNFRTVAELACLYSGAK